MSRSIPYRCEKCVEEASYTGALVFPSTVTMPVCKVHKLLLTPVENPRPVNRWIWEPGVSVDAEDE